MSGAPRVYLAKGPRELYFRESINTMAKLSLLKPLISFRTCVLKRSKCENLRCYKKSNMKILSNYWSSRRSKKVEEKSLLWNCAQEDRYLICLTTLKIISA